MKILLLAILAASLMPAADPVNVKRTPPPAKVDTPPAPAVVQELADRGEKLEQQESASPRSAPPGWTPPAVKLPPSAQTAAEISAVWLGGNSLPVAGRDGRVLFTFGAGLPVVMCSPLHVCVIELEPGEKITAEPAIGDSVRWHVTPRISGTAPRETTMVVVKPRSEGLDTNMVLTTDKRAYFLRLVSDREKYVARVGFEYPDEPSAEWKNAVEAQQANAQAKKIEATRIAVVEGQIENANFAYEIKAKASVARSLKPLRVFDTGGHTHIVMPPGMQERDAPVLLIHTESGKDEQVNYRVSGDTYIVDQTFDRAVLVLGAGKRQSRVEIRRQAKGDR
jgi:P-type conjugative transfer protein TrbG